MGGGGKLPWVWKSVAKQCMGEDHCCFSVVCSMTKDTIIYCAM